MKRNTELKIRKKELNKTKKHNIKLRNKYICYINKKANEKY